MQSLKYHLNKQSHRIKKNTLLGGFPIYMLASKCSMVSFLTGLLGGKYTHTHAPVVRSHSALPGNHRTQNSRWNWKSAVTEQAAELEPMISSLVVGIGRRGASGFASRRV